MCSVTVNEEKERASDDEMVSFPLSDKTNNPAHSLNGEQFVVKARHKPNVNKGGDIYLYELHGAKSKAGVPYSFLTDELIKL